MKKTVDLLVVVILIGAVMGIFLIKEGDISITGKAVSEQKITETTTVMYPNSHYDFVFCKQENTDFIDIGIREKNKDEVERYQLVSSYDSKTKTTTEYSCKIGQVLKTIITE